MDIYILWIFFRSQSKSLHHVGSLQEQAGSKHLHFPKYSLDFRRGAETLTVPNPPLIQQEGRGSLSRISLRFQPTPAALRWDFPAPTLFINPRSLSGSNEPKRSRGNFPWNGQETALNGQTERQPPKEPPGKKEGFSPRESRFVELDTGNNIQEGRSWNGGKIHGFGRVLAADSPSVIPVQSYTGSKDKLKTLRFNTGKRCKSREFRGIPCPCGNCRQIGHKSHQSLHG